MSVRKRTLILSAAAGLVFATLSGESAQSAPETTSTMSPNVSITGHPVLQALMAANAGQAQVMDLPIKSHTIADIAEKAAEAVVNIEVDHQRSVAGTSSTGKGNPPGEDDIFQFFFNGRQVTPREGVKLPVRKARGSGFIVRQDGYLVTNAHVVNGAARIKVTLNDKRSFDAKTVGTDTFSDLAVLKIEATGLPVLEMGTSSTLRPGDFAIAIGSPVGLDHTVTLGIISAVGRTMVDVNGNINFIQTDAAINVGNSGGPLLNLKGEVIGINTAVRTDAQNIGFSIPIDIAKNVATELIANRKISRPWLGIGMETLDEHIVKSLGLQDGLKGVLISKVWEGSSAKNAGMEMGDVLQKIEGKAVSTPKEVQDIVRASKVGQTLHFLLVRHNAARAVPVTIGEYPNKNTRDE